MLQHLLFLQQFLLLEELLVEGQPFPLASWLSYDNIYRSTCVFGVYCVGQMQCKVPLPLVNLLPEIIRNAREKGAVYILFGFFEFLMIELLVITG